MKLRSYLIALVVVAVLPVVIFTGVMIYVAYQDQRADLERGRLDTARALSLAVDRELEATIRILQTLGASEHLESGNLRQFYEQARRALKTQERWETIVLWDSGAHMTLNLLRPFDAPLPTDPPVDPGVKMTVELGRPLVSNLYFGRVAGEPRLAVDVPVIREGQVTQVLSAAVAPTVLERLLKTQGIPPDWLATIIDRNKVIIASTRDSEKFVGKSATALFAAKSSEAQEGVFRGFDYESAPVYAGFHRSELSGWTVALGAPIAEIEASFKRSLVLTGIGGSSLLLVAVALATILARRIVRPVSALAGAAEKLGRGETVQIPPVSVAEVDHIAREIEMAAVNRKRAEEALRESEARHRTILRTAMDGFWLMDMQGRLLEVNETYCGMSGYSEQELLAMSIPDLEAAETPAETVAHMQRVLAHGEDRFESRHRRKDGSSFAVEVSVQYKPAEGGQRVAFLRDITERKQAEDALRRSEASLEAAQQRARLGSWELDLKSGHRRWSKEMFRFYDRDPALGEPLLDDFFALVHPEDLASLRDAHKLAECADQPLSLVLRTNPAYGPIRYLDTTIHPVRDGRGECLQLAGTVLDVTERKRAEAQLIEQLEELRRWQAALIGREERSMELKREVNELLRRLGEPIRYPSQEE